MSFRRPSGLRSGVPAHRIASVIVLAIATTYLTGVRAPVRVFAGSGSSGQTAHSAGVAPPSVASAGTQELARHAIGELPLGFEINRGQTDARVNFLARGSRYTLFLTQQEAVLAMQSKVGTGASARRMGEPGAVSGRPEESLAPSVIRMRLLESNSHAAVTGLDQLPGVANYFVGNDPEKWQTAVSRYARVRYGSVYPGIDVVYYGNQGQLEYDLAVGPGASVGAIHLGFEGVNAVRVDKATGDLVLKTGAGEVRFHKPVAYQSGADGSRDERNFVEAHYVLEAGKRVSFRVPSYDSSRPLVIDPALSYSTYLGGSSNDYAASIAVDAEGNAYVTGNTTSVDFPIVAGALQPKCAGGCLKADAFVTKLDPTGKSLIYSTYIGGAGNDYGNGIALNSTGDAYVIGQTFSNDFPVTAGAFQPKCGGTGCGSGDAFVLELNSTGSQLIYSTYLGGKSSNQGNGITLDAAGDAYLIGYTQSTDFPTTPGVVQPTCTCSTSSDLFVAQLNPSGTALVYSTYLGGSSTDVGYSIALDPQNNAYVTGYTQSANFPTTAGAFQTKLNALSAAFVSKLNSTATSLVYSTYLGGNTTVTTPCEACGTTITVDSTGSAFVCGLTAESNFPITKGAYQTKFMSSTKGHDAFITKFNTSGSALVFSTYLGGTGDDGATGLKLDGSGNVWVKGNTKSTDFPVTPGAIQPNNAGDFDAYVSELDPTGSQLLYSTYLGGSGTEFGGATGMLALGSQNPPDVYLITYTNSTNFPVTSGAFQTANAGLNDGTVSLIVPSPNVQLSPSSLSFGDEGVGSTSSPLNVTVTNVGNSDLVISGITVTGANSSDFSQTNTCSDVPAQGTCTVSVTFTPAVTGTLTASISITDNAPGSPHTAGLTGTGIPNGPGISFSPASLTFGGQLVGTTSGPLAVTLTNIGNQDLSITSISTSGDFAASNNCGTTVAAGASCSVNVSFTPTKGYTRTGTLSVTDNAPGSPQTVSLTGKGTWVELSPQNINFGTVTVGTTSPPQTVTLTNTANFSIAMTGISLTGNNRSDYAQTNQCGSSVAAGASCTITVTFTPSQAGIRTASITIKDSGGASPQAVPLTGTGQ